MTLANTFILTFDNRRMYVPNRKIWSEVIENRSTERVRRIGAVTPKNRILLENYFLPGDLEAQFVVLQG